eukprot:2843795-Pleurochrysis_carterae.AAC.2
MRKSERLSELARAKQVHQQRIRHEDCIDFHKGCNVAVLGQARLPPWNVHVVSLALAFANFANCPRPCQTNTATRGFASLSIKDSTLRLQLCRSGYKSPSLCTTSKLEEQQLYFIDFPKHVLLPTRTWEE